MGGKSTTATQSVQIPPEVLARYNAVNARAEDVASRPFIPYSEDPNAFVASLTPSQRAGIENVNAVAGMSQPSFLAGQQMIGAGAAQGVPMTYGALGTGAQYADRANQAIGAGSNPVYAEQFSQEALQPYMSPYMKNVVEAQQALQQQEAAQQRSALNGQAIMSGAFGGDRGGIAQANLARQQSLANQATLAGLLQQGYTQGLGAFQQQQGVNLSAAQANRAAQQSAAQQLAALGQQQYAQQLGAGQNLYQMGLGAGQAYAGLGAQSEQQALAAAQAQMAAGQIQQQTDQAAKTAMYNQFLQQQGYPYQQAQFLGNLAMGTGALSGSTTTTTQPSGWSDRRLKENIKKIGKTFDGQDIYRYNLKGEKRTQIGLMAQDVEKKHPEAVGLSSGFRTLDYNKATDDAAKRGRFYQGGLVASMGGSVSEPGAFARGGYADGGDIESLYQDSLGRTGSQAEYDYWLGTGLSTDQIANAIASSPEAQEYASGTPLTQTTTTASQPTTTSATTNYGGSTLGGGFIQKWDEDGNLYYHNPETNRTLTARQYAYTFGNSYGDDEANPTSTQNVEAFYKSELGRTGTPEEYAYWENQLANGMSLADLQNAISNSPEGVKYDQSMGTTGISPIGSPAGGLSPSTGTGTGTGTGTTTNGLKPTTPTTTTTTPQTQTPQPQSWYGSTNNGAPYMATGIKNYPYQPALVYNQNAFVQSPYLARNAYGFYAAPQGSSYSSFANPLGQQQATGKGPSSMGGGYGYQPQAFAQPSYGYTPQATGKGPSSYGGYPSAPSYGGSMPQATGKGSSSGGGGWASGGRVGKADGGALLAQLAAQHMAQYNQMPGMPGQEPFSRIKHSLVKAEVPRHLTPGSLPARPQSGAKSAMETGKTLADLYKSGKEVKTDLGKLLDNSGDRQVAGGTTTKTTAPAGGSAPSGNQQQGGLAPDDNRNMTASLDQGSANVFDPFNRKGDQADLMKQVSLEKPELDFSDWSDGLSFRAGGRAQFSSGGGRLPTGLDPDGIDIPDELPGYKLNEQVPKTGGSGGGGGGNPLGTALTIASTVAKFLPFLPSDRRVKENAEVIGKLHDGQKVYRYDFGDGRTQLGLMAQEVEKHHPDAVHSMGGLKMVDYDKATSRAHKLGGGGLTDGRASGLSGLIDGVPYEDVTDEDRGLAAQRVRLAALSPSGTMSDAEPIGLSPRTQIAQAATASDASAPAAEPASVTESTRPPANVPVENEKKPSLVERATKVASDATEPDWARRGNWQQIGEKIGVPKLMQDERVFVPLIAGLGALLASDKPRFSQALGEGLAGAAGAYGAVRGQTQDIERSAAETRAIDTATYQKSFMVTPAGNFVWLASGGFMDAGEWDRLSREGKAPPLLGRIPGDAEETIKKAMAAKTAGASVQPPAVNPSSEQGSSTEKPKDGDAGAKPKEPGARTEEGDGKKPSPAASFIPGINFSDQTTKDAEKERELAIRGGPAAATAMATTQRYNNVTDTGANGAREAQRYLSELALNLSKAAKGKGLDVPGFGFNGRAELTNAFNTISRAFKGPEVGDSDTIRDINRKIETLQAAAKAAGGNQESFAALERLRGAIANPNMSPRAFSYLAADLMVQNQMALDRAAHKERYSKASNGFLSGAGSRFNADNPETKYTKETNALQQLILRDPKLLEDFRSGVYTPEQIDEVFRKSKFKLEGMSRYFGRGT